MKKYQILSYMNFFEIIKYVHTQYTGGHTFISVDLVCIWIFGSGYYIAISTPNLSGDFLCYTIPTPTPIQ